MSLYLAIDTATDVGSVAVGEPGKTMSEVMVTNRRHAAALAPAVDQVLRLAGAGLGKLAGIVIADGPGSFTGLRIACATAKGILFEYGELELWTAPSLLGAACGARMFVHGPVAALFDALRGEVFAAVYDFESGSGAREGGGVRMETLVPPQLTTVTELAAQCPRTPVIAVGDGAAAYAAAIRRWTGRDPVWPPAGMPRAGALLDLLAVQDGVTRVEDPVSYEPAYGRVAEAQARWEREHGRPLPDPTG